MLFLMNDVVLNLDAVGLAPPVAATRYRRLSLDYVSGLGRELYAEHPLLQYTAPERAARLAVMIMAKAPDINAALFVAPAFNCPIDQVSVRYAQIGFEVMGLLYKRQQAGKLTNVVADREVWRRLAA
jgi:hypothetical protein